MAKRNQSPGTHETATAAHERINVLTPQESDRPGPGMPPGRGQDGQGPAPSRRADGRPPRAKKGAVTAMPRRTPPPRPA